MICPNCSKEIKDSAAFCGYCGNVINKAINFQMQDTIISPTNKKPSTKFAFKWLFLIGFVALILGFVFGYFAAYIQLDDKAVIFPFYLIEAVGTEDETADDEEIEDEKEIDIESIESKPIESYEDRDITISTENGELIINKEHIFSCTKFIDEFANFGILLELNDEGKELFKEATADNIGKHFPIYVGEELISSPIVNEVITEGRLVISGMDEAEAEDLVDLINEIIEN